MKVFVTSDLHLFSRRTRADLHLAELRHRVGEATDLVLAGDIFDFRWSVHGSVAESVARAQIWLEELRAINPGCRLHYVFGNHDCVPEFTGWVEARARGDDHWFCDPYVVRLGNAAFLHGDVANPGMTAAGLPDYRRRFMAHQPRGKFMNGLYGMAVRLRLHALGAVVKYPAGAVAGRLARYLRQVLPDNGEGVRHVYFGHTHLRLRGHAHAGMVFHNGGAPMPGLEFEILEAETA